MKNKSDYMPWKYDYGQTMMEKFIIKVLVN